MALNLGPAAPIPSPSGYWGTAVYGSGDRVPMRAVRCTHTPPTGAHKRRHTCRQHTDHVGDHRCICGEKWPRT